LYYLSSWSLAVCRDQRSDLEVAVGFEILTMAISTQILAFLAVAVCVVSAYDWRRSLLENLSTKELERRGLLDCKEKFDTCWGTIPCCGETHCYFPKGINGYNSGYCVTCIKKDQICQRDEQCCGGMMCERSNHVDTQGTCMNKKKAGQGCYRDDQCQSGSCEGDEGIFNYYGECA